MIKNTPLTIVCILLVAPLSTLYMPAPSWAVEVSVPRATEVTLAFDGELIPGDVSSGDLVALRVVEDLVVDGHVVIEANADAEGEILDAVPHKWGAGSAIEVAFKNVDAADGTSVPLAGKFRAEGTMGGGKYTGLVLLTIVTVGLGYFFTKNWGSSQIPSGAEVQALVARDTPVMVPER